MTNAPPPGRGFLTNSLLLGPPRWQMTDKYPGVICTLGIDWAITTSSTPDHPLPLSKTESSTQGEFSSWILLAFSRLRDSGEIEKSFKNKKTHGGPLCQVARVLFSLCSFNTSPLSTICILRAWHRLGSCTSGGLSYVIAFALWRIRRWILLRIQSCTSFCLFPISYKQWRILTKSCFFTDKQM